MKIVWIISVVALLLTSCSSDISDINTIPNGVYSGSYQREIAGTETAVANITLTFTSDTWWGTSSIARYPAMCNGEFNIKNGTIDFVNQCVWTADFDWSLILAGEYTIVQRDEELEFYREKQLAGGTSYTDRFRIKLTEQPVLRD